MALGAFVCDDRRMRRGLLFGMTLFFACGGAPVSEHPVPVLSTSPEAGAAFAELRDAFAHEPHDSAMQLKFERFLARYPNDATVPLARLYLGHVDLDHGDVRSAREQLAAVAEPPEGNAHDFWLALRARLLRRDGKADDALTIMQPLLGTVVDAPLRAALFQEVALASIDARHSYEAVAYLDGWLRVVPPHDHKAAHDRAAAELARIDPGALEQVLSAMKGADSGGYSSELQRLVAESLAKHAIDGQDTRMAQRLIDSPLGNYLTGTAMGQDLRDLATSLRGAHAVAFRTIGLVLPTQTAELRDAAADAARGAAFALGLPRVAKDDDGTHLVTRADPGGGLEAALEELAGSGAGVILAGFDEASAEQACRWSEQNGLAVITLAAPKTPPQRFCFVAGESRATSIQLLLGEIERREGKRRVKVATIGGGAARDALAQAKSASLELQPPFLCEPPYSRSRMPLDDWRDQNVRAFLLSAPPACVRTMLGGLPHGSTVALSLESISGSDTGVGKGPDALRLFAAGAGVLPVADTKSAKDAQLDDYAQKFAAKPSYWTALGHDGALLGRAAEADLPNDSTGVRTEVTHRRDVARAGLLSAKAALWTTEAVGFAAEHRLPRALRVVPIE